MGPTQHRKEGHGNEVARPPARLLDDIRDKRPFPGENVIAVAASGVPMQRHLRDVSILRGQGCCIALVSASGDKYNAGNRAAGCTGGNIRARRPAILFSRPTQIPDRPGAGCHRSSGRGSDRAAMSNTERRSDWKVAVRLA